MLCNDYDTVCTYITYLARSLLSLCHQGHMSGVARPLARPRPGEGGAGGGVRGGGGQGQQQGLALQAVPRLAHPALVPPPARPLAQTRPRPRPHEAVPVSELGAVPQPRGLPHGEAAEHLAGGQRRGHVLPRARAQAEQLTQLPPHLRVDR